MYAWFLAGSVSCEESVQSELETIREDLIVVVVAQ